MYNLAALLYEKLGEREAGLAMMVEVAAACTTVLGPAHEDTKHAVRAVARWERQVV